ncbi:MAG: acetyl-CoA C-acetyltransferase [Planctomycetota bacterium]|nr:MAG: acetyl-CoA C-acetyltransferase [Planctomycetota bacterium]
MREVVITAAARTPIGRFLGSLKDIPAPKLGAHAIRAALERSALPPEAVDEVILGCVLQAGLGQNPARQAQIGAGIPAEIGAFTINKVCGSGLKAVALGAQAIRAGDADVIVAGGMENMSRAPHLLFGARTGIRLGHAELRDANIHDGLWDVYNDFHMGATAELVAREYGIGREEQDAFALVSHQRAHAATERGRFRDEIVPIEIPQRKGDPIVLDRDEAIRPDTSLEKLARLRPAFEKNGTVTAGNAPGLNDGAAALVLMAEEVARERGIRPLARITGYATGHREPEWVMMAPVRGVQRLVEKLGLPSANAFDLVELNEAFSVAAIAVTRELGLDPDKVNPDGGAVALGHPIGASGARILVTLLYGMRERGARTGLAALCLGGGGSVALAVEAID